MVYYGMEISYKMLMLAGLWLDLFGALILGLSAFHSDEDLKELSVFRFANEEDYVPLKYEIFKKERKLKRIGAIFLVVGFILQLIAVYFQEKLPIVF